MRLHDVKDFVMIDLGLGFENSANENFAIMIYIKSMKIFESHTLVGYSRKRFTSSGVAGTLAVSSLIWERVSLPRIHDVRENINAMRISKAIRTA